MSQSTASENQKYSAQGITGISVRGYKSLYQECSIEVRPLTILAGANSSGKSSIIQPLLMLKQTLEATYDPGALLINGPHVRFTSASQLLSRMPAKNHPDNFSIEINIEENKSLELLFKKHHRKGIELIEMVDKSEGEEVTLSEKMSHKEIMATLPKKNSKFTMMLQRNLDQIFPKFNLRVIRTRCFLDIELVRVGEQAINSPVKGGVLFTIYGSFQEHIRKLIHIPGLRGNPERTYKTTAVGKEFPGTFETYVASVVNHWQETQDPRLKELGNSLETLGLTWKVDARQVDDTQVELRVGRLPRSARGGGKDMVSIADVGFGVSQTLPVLVALLVANPGQLVYLEQPEIHLHPRAQAALAKILVDAANRGVRVIVETHSDLLLTRIQALVAEGAISTDKVKLHWFQRQDDGATEVKSADLDNAGAFGEWPVDFDEVALQEESRYLDAAESRLLNS